MITPEEVQRRHQLWSQGHWEVPANLDTSNFDFTWRPEPHDRPYIHEFGTQWQSTGGPKFVVPNNEGTKYRPEQTAIALVNNSRSWRGAEDIEFDYSWHPNSNDPPYIYVFGTQWQSTGGPRYVVSGATEVKYVDHPRAVKLENKNNRAWRGADNIEFDYSWHPDELDPPYIYVFGTQWHDVGGPRYVVNGATQLKYVNYPKATKLADTNNRSWRVLHELTPNGFDYSWHPHPQDPPMNYVFGNQWLSAEKMPTVSYRVKGATVTKYCTDQIANIVDTEVVYYTDSIVDAVKQHDFKYLYAMFVKSDAKYIPQVNHSAQKSTLNQFTLDIYGDGSAAHVPAVAKSMIFDTLLDYNNSMKHIDDAVKHQSLDIIYISNGESIADSNYTHLLSLTKHLSNRVIRVDGVNGRIASQYAAAAASNTDWYFLVNAKLEVNPNFDFSWQPDRTRRARHYIFNATNPVNDLEYGHQAIVANNKRLTLQTIGTGLDFTLESLHSVTRINSGIARYNTDAWTTWRTAFRECIKLAYATDSTSKYRLDVWSTTAHGDYSDLNLKAANDAIEYYNSVNGDSTQLMKTYDWAWLQDYYERKYGSINPK